MATMGRTERKKHKWFSPLQVALAAAKARAKQKNYTYIRYGVLYMFYHRGRQCRQEGCQCRHEGSLKFRQLPSVQSSIDLQCRHLGRHFVFRCRHLGRHTVVRVVTWCLLMSSLGSHIIEIMYKSSVVVSCRQVLSVNRSKIFHVAHLPVLLIILMCHLSLNS